ncbi:MAG: phosphate/phosphite/phosphonate ABC transporter substrate-binding protein [Elainellaceae cyanobacterium]
MVSPQSFKPAALLLSGLLLVSCGPPPPPPEPFVESEACAPEVTVVEVGISSSESEDSLKQQWEPLLSAMTDSLGRPVTGFYAADYTDEIEAMKSDKIQLAWLSGEAYVEAAKDSGAEAFATVINADGTQGRHSYLIAHRDNPLLEDIDVTAGNGDQYVVQNSRNLTFAFSDASSAFGYQVPMLYVFSQNDVDPNQAFRKLVFVGSDEATARAIANQEVDVAATTSETLAQIEASAPDLRENIQIIWTSPTIPTESLAYRNDLPDCLQQEIQTFFYDYQDSGVLDPLGWSGFVPATDQDWNPIRKLNIADQILDIQNDESLSNTAKQQEIESLKQQLEAL